MPQLKLPFERPERLNRQQSAILERLRQGPAKNIELSLLALRYSARICELRQMGHRIEIIERGEETGVAVYALRGEVANG